MSKNDLEIEFDKWYETIIIKTEMKEALRDSYLQCFIAGTKYFSDKLSKNFLLELMK